ncbi:MAG: HEAT repeat domain-containing protein, partial [Leptospirales bacterium]|nr:HEAT repeat domain-containing protein [Leptospirales bacterium]
KTIKRENKREMNTKPCMTLIYGALLLSTLILSCPLTAASEQDAGKKQAAENKQHQKKQVDPKEVEEKKVKWIKDTIRFGIQSERRDAINMIPGIKNETARGELYDLLVEALKTETNNEVTVKILTIMGGMKIKRGENAVIARLNDESEDIATAAVYTIKNMDAVSAKEKLIIKLKEQKMDVNSNLTTAIISTLAAFKAVEIMPFVRDKLKDNPAASSIREQMALYLGNIDTPESKSLLLELYKDEEEEVMIRCFAVNGLAKLDVAESGKEIDKVLTIIEAYPFKKRQRFQNLVMYSVSALVKLGNDEAVPRLIEYLKSDSAQVRLRAAELIKETGDKRTIDILKYKMKYDSDAKVKKAAENALRSMGVDVGETTPDDTKKTEVNQNEDRAEKE